ncbi:MAG: hypothetical protein LQ346_001982 [Caloplaca aetnensis]|nr:MAG: hypothetical protein LQ346_001982 [Caloplaca aetnensis]
MADPLAMTQAMTRCRLYVGTYEPLEPGADLEQIRRAFQPTSTPPDVWAAQPKKRARVAHNEDEGPSSPKLVKTNHQSLSGDSYEEKKGTMKASLNTTAELAVPPPSIPTITSSSTSILSDIFPPTPPPSPRPSTASTPIPQLLVTPPSPNQLMTYKPNGYWRRKRRPCQEPIYDDRHLKPPRKSFGKRTRKERFMCKHGIRGSIQFCSRMVNEHSN